MEPLHSESPSTSCRPLLRWLVSAAFLVLGLFFLYQDGDRVVIRHTGIPFGYLFIGVGAVALFCCLFKINIFRGGPLDMDRDVE
jgi:hypothetical protein